MRHNRHLLARPEAIVLALAAALMFGVTSVLQHSAAATVDAKHSMRPGLILELVRRPRWLLGNVTDVAGFAFQFLALRHGALLVVQALLVTGLLFTLPMAAALAHRRLSRGEWLSAVGLVTGLAVFLALANPSRGRPGATGAGWAAVLGCAGVAVGVLVLGAPAEPGRARARRLGAACGVLFAVTAALAKASGHVLHQGIIEGLMSWEPYAWLLVAGFGFLLVQSAIHAGPLDASMPLLVVADPLTSALIGVGAFHERIAVHPATALVEVLSAVVVILAVFFLARSPLVHADTGVAGIGAGPVSG